MRPGWCLAVEGYDEEDVLVAGSDFAWVPQGGQDRASDMALIYVNPVGAAPRSVCVTGPGVRHSATVTEDEPLVLRREDTEGEPDKSSHRRTGEVFTFRAGLGKRGLAGGLPTG